MRVRKWKNKLVLFSIGKTLLQPGTLQHTSSPRYLCVKDLQWFLSSSATSFLNFL